METNEEPVIDSLDCVDCGTVLVAYGVDENVIWSDPSYCDHLVLCRECEMGIEDFWGPKLVGIGCSDCRELREQDRAEALAEERWRVDL